MAFTEGNSDLDVLERFESFAERHPWRMALRDDRREMTYAELHVAAEGIAWTIRKHASDPQAPVVVLTGDDGLRCVGLLGAWKTGRPYVPIDPSLPEALVADMLENLVCGVLLTDAAAVAASRVANRRLEVLRLDEQCNGSSPTKRATLPGDALAWIIHTSGSTGRLKGVMQSYRNACHYVRTVIEGLRMRSEDCVAIASPLTAHAGVVYSLAALSSGARLCLITPLKQTPEALVRRLVEEQITVLFMVPTVFRRLAPLMAEHGGLPALRLLRLSGETVTSRDLQLCRQNLDPRCVLSVGLGTTETGGITHAYIGRTARIEGSCVPVGYPVDGVEVRLIDEHGHDVVAGLPGEIVVIGRYLSPGYLGLPELTNSSFLAANNGRRMYRTGDVGRRRPDGSFEHLGRKDLQVQVAGHRVEMAAVESVVSSVQDIREAAVLACGDSSGDVRLVAYVVADRDPPPTSGELRRQLREALPDYMIPSTFIFVDSLPLTPNGKVDRKMLPAPDQSGLEQQTPFVQPSTPEEKVIAEIWAQVLKVDRVGVHDHFFDLGGHSLLAMQIISRVREAFHVQLPLRALFDNPTVASLAVQIAQVQASKAVPKEMADVIADLESLSDEEAQRLLAQESPKGI